MTGAWYAETSAIIQRISPDRAWVRVAWCPACYRYTRFCAVYPPIYPSLHRFGCKAPPRAPVQLRIACIDRGVVMELSEPLHFAAGPMEGV